MGCCNSKVRLILALAACAAYEALGALAVRYVAKDGADTNDGLSAATPFASIAQAVSDLGDLGGRVYVAPGTYVFQTDDPMVLLDTPVEVVGTTGDPSDVVISRATGVTGRLFRLNNAGSGLRYLTIQGGAPMKTDSGDKDLDSGGNVWITSQGGVVADCIIRNGTTHRSWSAGGGNVFMRGGRLVRCRLIGGTNNTNGLNEWVYSGGSLVALDGVIENCIITGCSSGAAPVGLYHGSEMVNCTIADNEGTVGAIVIGAKNGTGKLPSVVNTAFFGNGTNGVVAASVLNKNATSLDYAKTALAYCAAETEINADCRVAADPRFMDAAAGDYRPQTDSALIDTGLVYSQTSATSTRDADGRERISGAGIDIGACESDRVRDVYVSEVSATATASAVTLRVALATGSLPAEATVTIYRDGLAQEVRYRDIKVGEPYETSLTTPGAYAFKVVLKGASGHARVRWADGYLADTESTVRFVSRLGRDANDGLTAGNAQRTIAQAVASLGEAGGKVYLAPGSYAEAGFGAEGTTNAIFLTTPVQLIALAGDPAETELVPGTGCYRVLKLDHDSAAVRGVTIRNGSLPYNVAEASSDGGNVWLARGTVENCVIRDGTTAHWAGAGANVLMKGGRLSGCTLIGGKVKATEFITGSYVWCHNGASLLAEGGIIENCVIRDCSSGSGPVAVNKSAKLVNSTIYNNRGVHNGGVVIGKDGTPAVVNCAIFGGVATTTTATEGDTVFGPSLYTGVLRANPENCFENCAAAVAINDTCRVVADPQFADPENGDFTPGDTSALVNAGKAYATTGARAIFDINGAERVFGAGVDIGACECARVSGARFTEKSIALGDGTVEVRLALVQKTAPVDVKVHVYRDGVVVDEQVFGIAYGLDLALTYDVPGYYVVKYQAYLSGDEVVSGVIGDIYLGGGAADVQFVSTTGSDANDGLSQATSKRTVQAAVDALGATGGKVYVAEGTHTGTNEVNTILVSAPVSIIGMATDPKLVKLCKSAGVNARIVRLNHADAALRNVWVSGGYVWSVNKEAPSGDSGAGVLITAKGGTVENCVISDGVTYVYAGGGGNLFMAGGRVSGCLIEGGCACNDGDDMWSSSGSSVCMHGGVLENCVIRGAVGKIENGVRKRLAGAPIVLYKEARMVNCTVADCIGSEAGAVLIRKNGNTLPSVVNCAFYNNVATRATEDYQEVYKGSQESGNLAVTPEEARGVFWNCASPTAVNDNCVAASEPAFRNAAEGDYSLTARSPLREKGANHAAAGGVSDSDCAGGARVVRTIDIGAYEYPLVRLLAKVRGLFIILR